MVQVKTDKLIMYSVLSIIRANGGDAKIIKKHG
jgi:hypothetical protein